MHNFDLQTLKLFICVSECKNIAHAAKQSNIAASAVSKRISHLEQSYQVDLLYRLQRGVELTQAGEVFYKHAKSILLFFSKLDADLSEFAEGVRGNIKIAANTSSITQFLPEDLIKFANKNPDVRINIIEDTSDNILAKVRDGIVDIGIYSGMIEVDFVKTIPYKRDTLVVIVNKNHPLANSKEIYFKQTLQYDHVELQDGSSLQNYLRQEAAKEGSYINTRVETSTFHGVRSMVQAGMGLAILPHGSVEPYLTSSELSLISLKDKWANRSLNIAIKKKESLSIVVRNLIAQLTAT